MIWLAAAALVGCATIVAYVIHGVLQVFDRASDLRAEELHTVLVRPVTWHDGEWEDA